MKKGGKVKNLTATRSGREMDQEASVRRGECGESQCGLLVREQEGT